jgi:hypothetical protein
VHWRCSKLQLTEDGPLLDAVDGLDAIQDLQQAQPPSHINDSGSGTTFGIMQQEHAQHSTGRCLLFIL